MAHIIAAVVSFLLGAGLVWLYARRYWMKRLYNAQQALSAQYSNDIQLEAQKTLAAIEKQSEIEERVNCLLNENERLTTDEAVLSSHLAIAQQELSTTKHTYEDRLALEKQQAKQSLDQLREQHESELIEKNCEFTSIKTERDECEQRREANLNIFFKENEALERTNQGLIADKQRLEAEIAVLQAALAEQKQIYEQDRDLASQKLDIDCGHIIRELFPNIDLLRDSSDEINRNRSDFSTLLFRIKALSTGDVSHSRKVRATHNVWSECRAPNMGMMRIYYRKAKDADRYEILISRKKDSKSQRQDIDWLKAQHN